ncbi:MAG: tetratricopeptide repeat protein [Acidobacteria bacterium]|nr:tetratricopeptide repeat protein [Acidobacteriota bacterium]
MTSVLRAFVLVSTLVCESATLAAQAPPFAALKEASESPATQRIELARKALAKDQTRADSWNELALGLARRARETADTKYYAEAWSATERSLTLEPGNLEGRKLQVWILLGQHEFQKAADAAEALNKAVPDDVLVYGFLADAYIELGRYAEAEKAAQWMLDMRPGNVPGLTRGAYLRELFGDHSGAVEFMDTAYRRTADQEVEDRAWILTHIAHLSLLTCRTEAAETLLHEALKLFPDYHYALARLSETRAQQGRLKDALDVRRRHYAAAPHPENIYELGLALERAGESAEAKETFARFEEAAKTESEGWDNANIELLYYYADLANRPADALAIAKREAARRQDVRTLEAWAWALHKSGQSAEALPIIERALKVGVKQPATFYHAGAIALAAGQTDAARKYLEQSVTTCPASDVAPEVKTLLGKMSPTR